MGELAGYESRSGGKILSANAVQQSKIQKNTGMTNAPTCRVKGSPEMDKSQALLARKLRVKEMASPSRNSRNTALRALWVRGRVRMIGIKNGTRSR